MTPMMFILQKLKSRDRNNTVNIVEGANKLEINK